MATPTTDTLIRFLLPGAQARGAIIRAEHIVSEGARVHGLQGEVGELFGQSLIAAILLLSISKGGVRQVLQLDAKQGHAPISRMLAESRSGQVRGYLNWQEDQTASRQSGDTPLSGWMGKQLHVSTVRDLGFGQPYVSTVDYQGEYLADAMVEFLHQSVQVRADVILHGKLGLMIEAMPGADDEHWFKGIEGLAAISNQTLETATPEDILQLLSKLDCQIVGQDDYQYACGCSEAKMLNVLQNMNQESLSEFADDQGKVKISCQYCERVYTMDVTRRKS